MPDEIRGGEAFGPVVVQRQVWRLCMCLHVCVCVCMCVCIRVLSIYVRECVSQNVCVAFWLLLLACQMCSMFDTRVCCV